MTAAAQQPAPRERPILFSAPMVKAILAGTKTQTRRVITAEGAQSRHIAYWRPAEEPQNAGRWCDGLGSIGHIACPYGAPGDRLWVRETWQAIDRHRAVYRATDEKPRSDGSVWRPSIFMPRLASRIDLEVTEVRVQRLQEISEEDARAEGITVAADGFEYSLASGAVVTGARGAFAQLWQGINGPRGYGWNENPWCWCIGFRKVSP